MPDMRFAPPNPLRIADRSSGLNAVSVRSYNERLVLSLLLENAGLSRLDIGQKTGLSAQTVSVLVRSLEKEGLIVAGEAQKGRMGPPTIPFSLNSDGAYSIGISLGHTHTDVVLVDFSGAVKFHTKIPNADREPGSNHSDYVSTVRSAMEALPQKNHNRIAGVGLALPEDPAELKFAPNDVAERHEQLREEIEAALNIEVYVQNDITAAAHGESMFGAAKTINDHLFCYLGARLHTRLVVKHQIFNNGKSDSHDVGLTKLESLLADKNHDVSDLWDRGGDWPDYGELVDQWRTDCVSKLSEILATLQQFVDVQTLVLSSFAPPNVCAKICTELEILMPDMKAIPGTIEVSPKAIGAASLPFSSKFMVES